MRTMCSQKFEYHTCYFFSRDEDSKAISEQLFHPIPVTIKPLVGPVLLHSQTELTNHLDLEDRTKVITTTWPSEVRNSASRMLIDFRHYRAQLTSLQKQMENWKPHSAKELMTRGYWDGFTWFSTVFGLVIAALGVIGIVTSIMQTVVAFISLSLQRSSR